MNRRPIFQDGFRRVGERVDVLNGAASSEIYTLSLHDALPIFAQVCAQAGFTTVAREVSAEFVEKGLRSEEHTSELQSLRQLVCRLLLEKKTNLTSKSYRRRRLG